MTRALRILMPITLLLATPAWSVDGAAPLWQPTTITQSGKYRVTRNITSATFPAIDILADDVEIDLNGFTVTGGIRGFALNASPDPTTKIENGTVVGQVLVASGGGTAVVRNLVVKNGGIGVVDNTLRVLVENNVVNDAPFFGITIEAVAAIVRNNIVDRPTQHGIHIEECSACDIVGNVVTRSQGVGIYAINGAARIIQNSVTRCAGTGIEVGNLSHVEGNVAVQNQGFGIRLGFSQAVYRGNTARGNNGTGCPNPTGADFCDAGTGNTSHGDNYMPGQM